MAIRALFPTLISQQSLIGPDQGRFNRDLADECRSLAASDRTGRRWSARHYLGGYTSYGSLDRLHLVSGLFVRLRRRIDPAFLPRPLIMVERLPRNATGKLPQQALERLANSHLQTSDAP